MLVLDQTKRNTAKECYDHIKFIQNCIKEQFKFVETFQTSRFNTKFLIQTSEGKLNQVRLIDSVNVSKDHIKEVLAEAISLTRVNGGEMIQNIQRYFIQDKHLYIVMNHFEVNLLNYLEKYKLI
jgi:hypothetical protein